MGKKKVTVKTPGFLPTMAKKADAEIRKLRAENEVLRKRVASLTEGARRVLGDQEREPTKAEVEFSTLVFCALTDSAIAQLRQLVIEGARDPESAFSLFHLSDGSTMRVTVEREIP